MSSDAPYWRPPRRDQYGVQMEAHGLEARFWITSGWPTIPPEWPDPLRIGAWPDPGCPNASKADRPEFFPNAGSAAALHEVR